MIAVAGSQGFEAPADRRADHITVDGRTLRFTDSGSTMSIRPVRRRSPRSTASQAG